MAKYFTVINATGPDGNIFAVLGYAQRFLKQLNDDAHKTIAQRVMAAPSYDAAIAIIEEFFEVDRG